MTQLSIDIVRPETDMVQCPRCHRGMRFIRSIPKLGLALPELKTYACQDCGEVETREVVLLD
jgi:hypothetical protein